MANDWQKAGDMFMGAGMGLQGQGGLFQRNMMIQREQDEVSRERQARREQERMLTVFTDAKAALGMAAAGRFDLIAKLGERRLKAAEMFPEADFSDTARLTQLAVNANAGDEEAAQKLAKELVDTYAVGQSMGLYGSAPTHSNIKRGEDGLLYGYNESTREYERINSPEGVSFADTTPKTTVNVNPEGGADTNQFGKALANSQVKRFEGITDSANKAMEQNNLLQRISQINVETGFGVRQRTGIAKMLNGVLGDGAGDWFMDQENIPLVESYNAIAQQMVNSEMNNAVGPQTDQDAIRFRDTMAGIDKEGVANDFLVSMMKEINNRKIEQARFYNKYLKDNGNLDGADDQWMSYKISTPLISESVIDKATGLPMLYSNFTKQAKAKNPRATQEQILEAWREMNGG